MWWKPGDKTETSFYQADGDSPSEVALFYTQLMDSGALIGI